MYLCSCVNPIWNTEKLSEICDKGEKIDKWSFLSEFYQDLEKITLCYMAGFPNDYVYYKYKDYYWYTHSAIEYFFIKGEK